MQACLQNAQTHIGQQQQRGNPDESSSQLSEAAAAQQDTIHALQADKLKLNKQLHETETALQAANVKLQRGAGDATVQSEAVQAAQAQSQTLAQVGIDILFNILCS